jgi:hypothetical protein
MDVVESMQTQQQQFNDAAEIQYQQTLNGFEQLSNWTLSDDDEDDQHHRNANTNANTNNASTNNASKNSKHSNKA